MSYSRVAVVTGANKGIGFAIVRQLALQYPKSALNNGPLLIYLTARDKGRGEEALKRIHEDSQLSQAKALASDGGLSDVKYHALDISKSESIKDLAGCLNKTHPEGIDIVINNASIALDGFDSRVVDDTLHSNYYGTLAVTRSLLPIIREKGRLVNMASMMGHLSKYSEYLQRRFLDSKSESDISALMEEFKSAVKKGDWNGKGWPSSAYQVSKCGVIGATGAIAKEKEAIGKQLLINSCCPGWVQTDMTKGRGYKTPDQGAKTPVMLAIGDIKKTGLFWQHEKEIEW